MDPKLEVSGFVNNSLKILKSEFNDLLAYGLESYLDSQTSKFYFTNTFLHRGIKKRLFDIYYPVKARYGELLTDFSKPQEVFEENRYVSIIGKAGSGKSTLAKFIFINALQSRLKIPVFIEFRSLKKESNLEDKIKEKLLQGKAKSSLQTLVRALSKGRFIFILDGFDEIKSDSKTDINHDLDDFIDKYPKNYFLVTSRPSAGIENYPRFHEFKVLDLNDNEIEDFIEKMVENQEKRSRIIDAVNKNGDKSIKGYLKNPLLLSMFLLTFENHPEIPQKRSAFYRNVFETLYSRHDGITKNAYSRERVSGLIKEEFELVLQQLSYLKCIKGEFEFTEESLIDELNRLRNKQLIEFESEKVIYDLCTSISIIAKDDFIYSFPHRSLQEYFTACFLKTLPEEIKSKNFNNIYQEIFNSSRDNSYILWLLSKELDKQSFIKFFIIPCLKEVLTVSSNCLENHQKWQVFLDLMSHRIYIQENRKTKSFVDSKSPRSIILILETRHELPHYVLEFIGLKDFHSLLWRLIDDGINISTGASTLKFWEILNTKISEIGDPKNMQMTELETINFGNLRPSQLIFPLLIDHGLESLLKGFIQNLNEKIESLENEEKDYTLRLKGLLNI